MPTAITLKGIPDDEYERHEASAAANQRSQNSEVIACIGAALMTRRTSVLDQLTAIRAIRSRLSKGVFKHEDIDRFKRQGRA